MNDRDDKPVSEQYIFKRGPDKRLRLVGDFDGYYRNHSDPWGQSGNDDRMREYYRHSRSTLIEIIGRHGPFRSLIEVGCGHGYVTGMLADAFPDATVSGIDISAAATRQARQLFPNQVFIQADIAAATAPPTDTCDVIILNQLLWYILERLENVFSNCQKMLSANGLLVISNAFLKRQEYGREIINGFDGLLKYYQLNLSLNWELLEARYDDSGKLLHHDGVMVLRRRLAGSLL